MSTAGVDRNIYIDTYYFVPPEFQYFSHALIYTKIILRTQYIFTPSSGMYCRHCRVQPGTFGPDSLVPLHNFRQHHLIFICLGRVTGSIMTCMNLTLYLNFSSISHVLWINLHSSKQCRSCSITLQARTTSVHMLGPCPHVTEFFTYSTFILLFIIFFFESTAQLFICCSSLSLTFENFVYKHSLTKFLAICH